MSWIGSADLNGAERNDRNEPGPIIRALGNDTYERVILLNNFQDTRVDAFRNWLQDCTGTIAEIRIFQLANGPTGHKEVYEAARNIVRETQREYPDAELTFHLSSGTSAMAVAWLLLASTFGAKLIETSIEKKVQAVQFPFEIAASFLPDKDLTRMTGAISSPHPAFNGILHRSADMRQLIDMAQYIASRNVPVLIEGESGTGKELFANAIHAASSRKENKFIPVNCGAIPADLVESELFGHKRGAFTGAGQDKPGVFQEVDKGTLFLDELGELPLPAQVKLLRVLNDGMVTPVGDTKSKKVDVRIIAATNRSLIKEVSDGRFRSDLFYRIAVAVLRIPPLRDRGKDDIELLLDEELRKANAELRERGKEKDKYFSDGAKKIMLAHSWPGNVRELYNTVMRAALLSRGELLIDEQSVRQAIFFMEQREGAILNRPLGNGFSLDSLLSEVEGHYIQRAETESRGVKTRAAELLGFNNYQTFVNRQKKITKLADAPTQDS
ncbi:MAG: sigma 54-interacting transcriptional regulator [Acidobacteriota bacterium]|nr:sigma 54-interacting transcriptional regulator [Acidobacteriota bacterium]